MLILIILIMLVSGRPRRRPPPDPSGPFDEGLGNIYSTTTNTKHELMIIITDNANHICDNNCVYAIIVIVIVMITILAIGYLAMPNPTPSSAIWGPPVMLPVIW